MRIRTALILSLIVNFSVNLPAHAADRLYTETLRTSLYVPVRDGTKLAVNIYRPAKDGKAVESPLPTIFAFTPYRARIKDKDGKIVEVALSERIGLKGLTDYGYVVAVADIRGKGASFGHRRGFQDRTEAKDGYDLIEWLAHRPYSTGKVGMMGCSYLGGTTFQTATTAPPSLKAIFSGASELDKYAFVRRGGITAQFNTRPDEPLSDDLMSIAVDADTDGGQLKAAVAQHAENTPMAGLWYGMPYRDSISKFTGNKFWDEVAVYRYLNAIKKAGIKTYFWGNWHDEPTAQVLQAAANLGGKFLAGPGNHCEPPADFDFQGELRRWFDHTLKGVDNGIDREPRATYWVEGGPGGHHWVKSNILPGSAPGSASVRQSWFLGGGKSGTARSANDGIMGTNPVVRSYDTFTVNYDLPPVDYFAFWAGPMDDKGLSYTSAPFTKPLTLIGFPILHLNIAVDKPDANVFGYLDLVDPQGKAEVISFGRLALSHRKLSPAPYQTLGVPWHSGMARDVSPVTPNVSVPISFDLTPISRIIAPGYRLRVTIAGADPRQRNLADIKQTPAPKISVTLGGATASRIELPVAKPQ